MRGDKRFPTSSSSSFSFPIINFPTPFCLPPQSSFCGKKTHGPSRCGAGTCSKAQSTDQRVGETWFPTPSTAQHSTSRNRNQGTERASWLCTESGDFALMPKSGVISLLFFLLLLHHSGGSWHLKRRLLRMRARGITIVTSHF